MIILGISHVFAHNQAACILVDGHLLAFAEEERFNRVKHAPSTYPKNAIEYCLRTTGIKAHQVDYTAIGFGMLKENSIQTEEINSFLRDELVEPKALNTFLQNILIASGNAWIHLFAPGKRLYFDHHACHAASSFIPSGFNECNVITLDGWGNDSAGLLGVFRKGQFEILNRIAPNNSWGVFYEVVTDAIGFRAHSAEGKTMGLAPYGKVNSELLPDWCDEQLGLPDVERYRAFVVEKFYHPKRQPHEPLTNRHKDLAATLQFYYERSLVKMSKWLSQQTGLKKFALAGGVALNCTGNGHLAEQEFVEDIFVQPASHDG